MSDDVRDQVAQRLLKRALEVIEHGDLCYCPDLDVWDLVGHLDEAGQRAACDEALQRVDARVHLYVQAMMARWLTDLDWKRRAKAELQWLKQSGQI